MLIAVFLLLLLIVLAGLGGGILAWTTSVAGILVSLVWAWNRCHDPQVRPTTQIVFAALFIIYLLLSIVPLPQSWFKGSPIRQAQNHFMQERLYDSRDANFCDIGKPKVSISRNRAGTSRLLLLTITTLVCGALASRLDSARQEQFIKALVILASTLAIAGALSQWVFPQGKNLWWLIPVEHGKPVGCFINRNHFGGYLGLLVPASLIVTTTSFFNRSWLKGLGWMACSLVLLAAIFLSHSRGAWLATAAGIAVVSLLIIRAKPALGVCMVILGIVLTLGAGLLFRGQIAERLATLRHPTTTLSGQMRMDTWDDCLPLFQNYALLGAGGNAFRVVFPQIRSADTRKSFGNAENEYLQVPVELGIIGTTIAVALAAAILLRWKRNRLMIPLCVHASILGATAVCLVHACFDFAPRVPLYAITLGCLIGMSQAYSPDRASTSSPLAGAKIRPYRVAVPLLGLAVIIAVSLQGRGIYKLDSPDYLKTASRLELAKAITWAPTSPWAWFNFGRVAMRENNFDIRIVAERCVTAAAMYDPNNYVFWRELAPLRLTLGNKPGAQEAYTKLKALREWAGTAELDAELSVQP